MSFAAPWAWLWVLALLPVFILHFLRKKERDWPVSALFLWEGVRPDRPRFVERLRARFDLLLLLQVLAVILGALALSRPEREIVRPAGPTLLVLDASASMAAEGMREKVLAKAKDIVGESTGPWAAVLWAEPPALLFPSTSDRELVLSELDQYGPRLTPRPELHEALALLPEPWPRVVVITDNPKEITGAEVVAIPRPENVGITAFSVRPSPDGVRYEAFLRVVNATSAYKDMQIRVISEAGEFWASRLVPPGEEEEVVLVLPGARAGAFVAELRPTDSFPWDNVRYFVLEGGEVATTWLGLEDRYLWAALRAGVSAYRVSENPDLFVAVSTNLSSEPPGPCLLVASGCPGAAILGEAEAGPLSAAPNPLLENLSLSDWRIGRVYRQEVPPGAQVLLWAGEIPILFLWESSGGRKAAFAADLSRTNLPLLPDFPILIRNLLSWLLPQRPEGNIIVGQSVELPPGFSVVTELGAVQDLWVPEKPGIFRIETPRGPKWLAVNVPWETVGPEAPLAAEVPKPLPAKASLPLWPWATVAFLFVLGAEALVFLWRGG